MSKSNTDLRRRRDATVELRRVGVGGMYWAVSIPFPIVRECVFYFFGNPKNDFLRFK